MTEEICTICTDVCDSETATHVLACGHIFHVECVMHWFRFENTCCPNCRSNEENKVWMRKSVSQRVGLLRRKRTRLPRLIQKRLEKLDEYRETAKVLRTQRKEMKRKYSDLFRTYNTLHGRIRTLDQKHEELKHMLSRQASEHVPFLEPYDVVETFSEEESDDDQSV